MTEVEPTSAGPQIVIPACERRTLPRSTTRVDEIGQWQSRSDSRRVFVVAPVAFGIRRTSATAGAGVLAFLRLFRVVLTHPVAIFAE
jgi:hypothetical protein